METTPLRAIKFETERLHTAPVTKEISEPPEHFDLLDDPEFKFEEPVTGELTARIVGSTTVLISGFIRTVAKAPCGRCLEDLRLPIRTDVHLTYMTDPRLKEPDKFPELVDTGSHWYDGELIYPIEQLREALLLELPHTSSCELEEDDTCPVRGVKVGPFVFGPSEEEEVAKPEDPESLASKLKKLRKDLNKES